MVCHMLFGKIMVFRRDFQVSKSESLHPVREGEIWWG